MENNTLDTKILITTPQLMTVVTNKNLRKKFTFKNGSLAKEAIANFAEYEALTIEASLENILIAVEHGTFTIIAGYIRFAKQNQLIKFLSLKNFTTLYADKSGPFADVNDVIISTRSKEDLQPSPILLIDYDVNAGTPEGLNKLTPQELIEKLAEIFPPFLKSAHVINYGSSSGITAPDGTKLTSLASVHIYFEVNDANDIERFKNILKVRCILKGWYWESQSKSGALLLRTIFDVAAISHERFCYETLPILENGLTRNVPDAQKVDGAVLNTQLLKDLDESEKQDLHSKFKDSKSIMVRELENTKGIVISNLDNTLLTPDTIITFSDGMQTTPSDFFNSEHDKVPCYAPFRDDHTPSAFIAKHAEKKGFVYVYDSGWNITYFCTVESSNALTVKGNEKVVASISNFESLINNAGIYPRYNVIKKTLDIPAIKGKYLPDNEKSAFFASVLSLCAENEFQINEAKIKGYLVHIADQNSFNPVERWIKEVDWDGEDRVSQLTSSLVVDLSLVVFRACTVKRWLIGCIASALSITGEKNEIVLTLSGDQGLGKTTFFKSLAPKNSGWIKDGMSLNPNNKDSVKQAISYWFVELGEVESTFKKSDISSLKAFLSMSEDELRLPYAPDASNYPRRTAFCASVNSHNFLVDDTGNRRFAVLEVGKIIPHNLDIQQLWAQVLTLYEAGEQWWFTPKEEALQRAINKNHQVIEPLEEMLDKHFKMNASPFIAGPKMTATEVLQLFGVKTPDRRDATRMGNLLTSKGLMKIGRKYQMPEQIVQASISYP